MNSSTSLAAVRVHLSSPLGLPKPRPKPGGGANQKATAFFPVPEKAGRREGNKRRRRGRPKKVHFFKDALGKKPVVVAALEALHEQRPDILQDRLDRLPSTESQAGNTKRKRDSAEPEDEVEETDEGDPEAQQAPVMERWQYEAGDAVSVLFYKGEEGEEWFQGAVCQHGMRTPASGRFPYYDITFIDADGAASFAWVAPHKDDVKSN